MISARKLALLMAAMSMMSSMAVYALGVGNLTLRSSLNEPLSAEIDLLGVRPGEAETITVSLARKELFDKMGLERTASVESLRFRVMPVDGDYAIRVTSKQPLREPFLSFLLEVNWPSGRVLREFTVLLDPPVFSDGKAAPVAAPETSPPPDLSMPPSEPLPEPTSEAKPEPIPPAALPGRARPLTASSGELVYGPTQRGDVLWRIAEAMRKPGVTREQMMLALLRDNPGAFFGDNVNMLKAGHVLRIREGGAVQDIPQTEAVAEIARQHESWLAWRAQGSPALAAGDRGAESGDGGAPFSVPGQARLRLVSPAEEAGDAIGNSGDVNAEINDVNRQLTRATEAAEAARAENEVLRDRLAALEQQVAALQRLVELRDQELRLLQQKRALEEGEPAVPPTEVALSEAESSVPDSEMSEEQPESLWGQPGFIATMVGGVIGLALLAWIYERRRRAPIKSVVLDSQPEQLEGPETGIIEATDVRPLHDQPEVEVAEVSEQTPEPVSEPASGPEAETPAETVTSEFGDIDPLSEADVYVAYGRYQKAKELLNAAIKADPERHELKLKLLEVLYLEQDKDGFAQQAEELYAALGGREDDPLWQQAALMGHELLPQSNLFPASDSELVDDVGAESEWRERASFETDESFAGGDTNLLDQGTSAWQSGPSQFGLEQPSDLHRTSAFSTDVPSTPGRDEPAPRAGDDAWMDNLSEPAKDTTDGQPDSADEWGWLEGEKLDSASEITSQAAAEEIADSAGQVDDAQQVAEASEIDEVSNVADLPDMDTSFDLEEISPEAQTPSDTGGDVAGPQSELSEQVESQSEYIQALVGDSAPVDDIQQMDGGTADEPPVVDAPAVETPSVDTPIVETPSVDTPTVETPTVETPSLVEEQPWLQPEDDQANERFDENSFFLFTDEVGTKLDLARAYIEMGDHDGAREILEEVLEEGNDQQRREAGELMNQAAGG